MVGGKEADEKWACSQHVYIAYMMAGENRTLSAAGGKLYLLGLIGKGDSSEVVHSFSELYPSLDALLK